MFPNYSYYKIYSLYCTSLNLSSPNSLYLSLPKPYIVPPLNPTSNHWFVLYILESASFLLYSLVCSIFYIPCISDIIEYLSFWHISISIIPSKSIYVAANGKILLFCMTKKYSIGIYIYTHTHTHTHTHHIFFVFSSVAGYLSCFRILAILYSVAMNIGVQTSKVYIICAHSSLSL